MHVLLLSWEFPPSSVGGTAAHVDGLADALTAAGHDVRVITRRVDGVGPTGNDPTRVIRVDTALPWLPDSTVTTAASGNHAMVRAGLDLGGWVPDVVHAHDWQVAWAADVVAGHHRAALVTTFHSTERSRHGGHLPPGFATDVNAIEWWLAWRSQRIIAATNVLRSEIVVGFEVTPNVVERVPTAIDPRWWSAAGDDETGEREPLVFAWGRVQYEKGFLVLARAMAQVRTGRPDVRCVVAGRGGYLPELQSQIDIAGVGDLIELPGFVSDQELRSSLHRAGCVVIPSLYEPFGTVVLEALASGCPLVVADTGGLAERLRDTDAALLFEPGNSAQLAMAIERVLGDPRLADDLAQRASELVRRSFSWEAVAAAVTSVYEAALATVRSR